MNVFHFSVKQWKMSGISQIQLKLLVVYLCSKITFNWLFVNLKRYANNSVSELSWIMCSTKLINFLIIVKRIINY